MTGSVWPANIFFCSTTGNDTIYIHICEKRLSVIHREINYTVYRQQCQIEIRQTTGTRLEPKCDSSAHQGPRLAGVYVCVCVCARGRACVCVVQVFF